MTFLSYLFKLYLSRYFQIQWHRPLQWFFFSRECTWIIQNECEKYTPLQMTSFVIVEWHIYFISTDDYVAGCLSS